jgi:DNA modification methylase
MARSLEVIFGSGAAMHAVPAGGARLVLTGPPYFPVDCEAALRAGNIDAEAARSLSMQIEEFTFTLRPVFRECRRVLCPGGTLVVQTRDVRLGTALIPVEALHRQIIEGCGFELYTRYLWRPLFVTGARSGISRSLERVCGPLPIDPEVFLVFKAPGRVAPIATSARDRALLSRDFHVSAKGRLRAPHRFQAPLPLLRAIVRVFSLPDDLVLDPFAGGGTSLCAALMEGRRAVGYEIDRAALALARRNVEAIT